MATAPKSFIWYELMTTDLDAAEAFYRAVVGWEVEEFSGGVRYKVVKAGSRGVGGLMDIPKEMCDAGGRPCWMGYILADDIDAKVAQIKAAGGRVYREPTDIPDVGRFAVVADPQGVGFMLLAPKGEGEAPAPGGTVGHVGWHELYTTDWKAALAFYGAQFGWTADQAMDMGPMGTYQLFAAGGPAIGGMMNKPPHVPAPGWLFYFNVPEADAAAVRVKAGGGKVMNGPMEVPGGSWILQCADPQGAMFALAAAKR